MYKLNNDTSRISVRFIEVLLYQRCPEWVGFFASRVSLRKVHGIFPYFSKIFPFSDSQQGCLSNVSLETGNHKKTVHRIQQ